MTSIVGPDAEPRRDARPEPLEHDVGPRKQRARQCDPCVRFEVADDGFLARVQRGIPGRRGRAHRVAVRRLDAHDARPEAQQLAPRVRTGQVARQIGDEEAGEWRHDRVNL